ncbi:DsbA family protein [Demequina flava]|uniref:DsbA family protein n=1 Tax=Demequina flava TaxID=1095025 RepID=UPI000783B3A4|nr:DsbA family protein [Demequina flava]
MPAQPEPFRFARVSKIAALTGALAIGLAACSTEVSANQADGANETAPAASATPSPSDSPSAEVAVGELPWGPDSFGAVPIGTDGAAYGDVATGDVPVIDVYADFACHYCMLFEAGVAPALEELASSGDAVVVYHPVSILDRNFPSKYSTRSAAAALAVANTAPEVYLEFTASLMASQPDLPEDGWTEDQLADLALEVGAPQETADAILSDEYEEAITDATVAAFDGGMSGTPSVAVNGELLNYEEINYIEPGVLVEYLDTL